MSAALRDTQPRAGLPDGYHIEFDVEGDAWLIPPTDVTIFSQPGEAWLITDDYMSGRDWNKAADLTAASLAYLADLVREERQ